MTENDLIERLRKLKAERYGDSDIESAKLMSDLFPEFLYSDLTRSFWSYDGMRYKADREGTLVQTALKLLASAYPKYIVGLDSLTDDERNRLLKQSARWQSLRYREKILRDMKPNRLLDYNLLDKDKYALNVKNGVVKLGRYNMGFEKHSPEQMFSKVANVEYDDYAKCPKWNSFLVDIFQGDKERIKYVQKLLGLCLTGDTTLEQMYFFHGATTRNGKSTLIETFEELLGDYAVTISPDSLCKKNYNDGAAASPDIAQMRGARLIKCSEFKKGSSLDVAGVKQITGNDTIQARRLYEEPVKFKVEGKLICNTNFLPLVTDNTLFRSDRARVIPFNKHYEENERDTHLKEKLMKELPGILLWCIEGLKLFYGEGLASCVSVKEATESYKHSSDKVGNYIEDCLAKVEKVNISVSEAYTRYEEWCSANGYRAEGKRGFIAELDAKGIYAASGTVKGKTVRNVIKGYGLAE